MIGTIFGLALVTVAQSGATAGGAYLGIRGEDAKGDRPGVVVQEVQPDSPASRAGLSQGDTIVALDGQPVDGFDGLQQAVAARQPGQKLTFKVVRDGKEREVPVELGKVPERPRPKRLPFELGPDGAFRFRIPGGPGGDLRFQPARRPMIGIQLQSIDDTLRQRLGLSDRQGALVADVVPNSPASKADIRSADVIVKVDGKDVEGPAQLTEHIAGLKLGDTVTLTIVRDGQKLDKKVVVEEMSPFDFARRWGSWLPGVGDPQNELFVPRERVESMQKRIDELEAKVRQLTQQVEELKKADRK